MEAEFVCRARNPTIVSPVVCVCVCVCMQAIYMICVDCQTFSPTITKLYLGYILSLLVLFVQFYIRSYSGGKGKKAAKEA